MMATHCVYMLEGGKMGNNTDPHVSLGLSLCKLNGVKENRGVALKIHTRKGCARCLSDHGKCMKASPCAGIVGG